MTNENGSGAEAGPGTESGTDTVRVFDTAGFHENLFVTERGAVNADGAVPAARLRDGVKTGCSLIQQPRATADELELFDAGITACLIMMQDPGPFMMGLGWSIACFAQARLLRCERFLAFPPMFLTGPANSGRQAMRNTIQRLWSLDEPAQVIDHIEKSQRITARRIYAANSIPHIVEIPEVMAGRVDLSYAAATEGATVHPRPICITGERVGSDWVYSVQARFAEQRRPAVFADGPMGKGISEVAWEHLGRSVLDHVLSLSDEEVWQMYEREEGAVHKRDDEDGCFPFATKSAAVIRLGLTLLEQVLGVEIAFDRRRIDELAIATNY